MTKKLKIGLLTDNYPDSGGMGGIGTYTKIVAEELARMGHEAHVFTPAPVVRHRRREINGVHVWECPTWAKRREMPPQNAVEFTLRYKARAHFLTRYTLAVAVRQAASSGPFDVIESPEFAALGSVIPKWSMRRLAVRLHLPSGLAHALDGTEAFASTPINEAERALALRADVITAPSNDAYQRIARYWDRALARTVIVGNPLSWLSEDTRHASTGCSAVYFGRLESRKGIDTFAAVLGRLKEQLPDFQAAFVGANNTWFTEQGAKSSWTGAEEIGRIAAETGGAGTYTIHPAMPRDQLKRIVQNATVCVVPSRCETFGYSLLEAMLWKTPCVVSDIPVFRELARDEEHCLFAKLGDVSDFCEKITSLLNNAGLRHKITETAFEHTRLWRVDRIVPKLIDAWMS